jgi:hypothetical protein
LAKFNSSAAAATAAEHQDEGAVVGVVGIGAAAATGGGDGGAAAVDAQDAGSPRLQQGQQQQLVSGAAPSDVTGICGTGFYISPEIANGWASYDEKVGAGVYCVDAACLLPSIARTDDASFV